MNFLKSLGGLVGTNATTGGLPYVLDAPAPPPSSSSSSAAGGAVSSSSSAPPPDAAGIECGAFLLFPGHAKGDASSLVSVFKSSSASPPALNALRRLKTLRHPNVLAFVDGVETPNGGAVVLVTERVTPLPLFLDALRHETRDNPEAFAHSVAWGLRSVLLALQFLTVDCKLTHGALHPHSVFVTRGGDWKLGGLELTSERSSSSSFSSSLLATFGALVAKDPMFQAPEAQRRDWSAVAQAPTYALDVYAFAALVFYVFNPHGRGDPASAANVPHALRMPYRKALDADPGKRPSPDKMLASSFFDTPFIKRLDFLDNLAVKTPEEKAEFYKDLATHLDALPPTFAVHKVLPALKGVVEFGAAAGGGSKNAPVLKLDPSASYMLPAMVQIGSSLSADEFKDQVLPVIVKLFSCNDRAVRVQLLQMMEKFAVHFDAKLVNSAVIFDNLCSGFTDAAPVLRELTVKSMLHIADKLSDANLNTRVMKYFAKLQTDPEPAIRTNTTICLGRIAPKLNDATRPKVLFPAFSRALRDPFPHARLAGLRSLTACEEFFTPQGMASSIVPVIAPLLLDVSISVREQASLSMDLFMKKVMDEAAQMKIREEQQAHEQKLRQESGATDAPGAAPPAGAAQGHSNGIVSVAATGSSYAASLTSWAASAVASNVGKIVSGSGSHATPPSSTSSTAAPAQQQQSQPVSSTFSSHTASSSSSAFTSAPAASSTSNAFAADDDFGGEDDAWGDDDDLDGFGSPKAPTQSTFSSSSATRTGSASSSSSMKLSTSTRPTARTSASSSSASSSTFAMAPADGGWGDDNWGGDDDDLGFGDSTPSAAAPPASSLRVGATSLQLGNAASRTSSFGNTSTANRTTSFASAAPTASSASFFTTQSTTTPPTSTSSGASSVRKPVSERLAEAKAKRESLGAMKLETTKKGDEWDNWDF